MEHNGTYLKMVRWCKMDEKYIQKIIENEQRSKSNSHRIDEIESEQKNERDLILAVKELAQEVKRMREDVSKIDSRLTNIETKPAKRWEQIISLIITRYSDIYTGFFYSQIRNVKGEIEYGTISYLGYFKRLCKFCRYSFFYSCIY